MSKYLFALFIVLSLCSCSRRRENNINFFNENHKLFDTLSKNISANINIMDTLRTKEKYFWGVIDSIVLENHPEVGTQFYPVAKLIKNKKIIDIEVVDSSCFFVILSTEDAKIFSSRFYLYSFSSKGKCDFRDTRFTSVEFEHKLGKNWYYQEIFKAMD